jgi:aspartyl-tRNA(Asn)/glutamyl-tRNA(Gln) amidotransferase subunit B
MFCPCGADYQSSEPNTRVCPVCLALPGTLPVVNRQAVEYAMMIGLALNCQIAPITKFDRKNYSYPDLMKGYQISQFDMPICFEGYVDLPTSPPHRVRINRVHMEEDVAKLTHIAGPDGREGHALMDVNRAGVPLMEIVTEPDMRSTDQVVTYIEALQSIIRYLGVGTANMEEGSFRCDANVSVRPVGHKELTTKVEVKNMNRISAVARAIEYEIERQIKVYESGERVTQDTRGWDDATGTTRPQRSKEFANDYRYFAEPDIPPLQIDEAWITEVRSRLPELPSERKARLMNDWGLSEYDASLITALRATAEYFDEVVKPVVAAGKKEKAAIAKEAANWMNGELLRLMNDSRVPSPFETKIGPLQLAALVDKFRRRELNNSTAKQVFEEMWRSGRDPDSIIEERGFGMVSDTSELEKHVDEAIRNNPKAVEDYLAGKEASAKFLMGQVMKATKGQADPPLVQQLIADKLDALR